MSPVMPRLPAFASSSFRLIPTLAGHLGGSGLPRVGGGIAPGPGVVIRSPNFNGSGAGVAVTHLASFFESQPATCAGVDRFPTSFETTTTPIRRLSDVLRRQRPAVQQV